jgi:hypothetical protein
MGGVLWILLRYCDTWRRERENMCARVCVVCGHGAPFSLPPFPPPPHLSLKSPPLFFYTLPFTTQIAGVGKKWVSVGVIEGKAQMITTPNHRVLLYPNQKGGSMFFLGGWFECFTFNQNGGSVFFVLLSVES